MVFVKVTVLGVVVGICGGCGEDVGGCEGIVIDLNTFRGEWLRKRV